MDKYTDYFNNVCLRSKDLLSLLGDPDIEYCICGQFIKFNNKICEIESVITASIIPTYKYYLMFINLTLIINYGLTSFNIKLTEISDDKITRMNVRDWKHRMRSDNIEIVFNTLLIKKKQTKMLRNAIKDKQENDKKQIHKHRNRCLDLHKVNQKLIQNRTKFNKRLLLFRN